MKAFDVLRDEHVLIRSALDRLELAIAPPAYAEIERLLTLLERFVDGVHQQKEEEVLFPVVRGELREMVHGALEAMTKEHFMARAYLKAAVRALPEAAEGDPSASALLHDSATHYVALVRAHVDKEDEILFPFVERALREDQDEVLCAQLANVEADLSAAGDREALAALVKSPPPEPEEPAEPSFIDARTLSDEPERRSVVAFENLEAGASLYDDGVHSNVWLHDFGRGLAVQANQFLIVHDGHGMVLDPGGPKVYPDVYAETMLRLGKGRLDHIFLSHQDPDIGTSLNAWLMDTDADAYVSRLWVRFLPHFGIDRLLESRLHPIPDEGMVLKLGDAKLILVPAHFLHSPGNFHVYDPTSKVLFSGDVGASMGTEDPVVRDFDAHVEHMAGFHRRYIATGAALRAWARAARQLDVETIAPQHGSILVGREMVNRFFDWCEDLPCGVDVWPELFTMASLQNAE
ncbi:MAG: hemerythrin domain-containing protein [Deltaproteobacteria bacterium]|jgi:hemerythrin-like domain-containing protein/glyoxylase-like metal-dependent hydrolase (beta-lactamase superfamily II)